MDRSEAIKQLVRGGQQDAVVEAIDRHADRVGRAFEQIRADSSRTDDYKRWALAVASHQASRGLTDELVGMAGRAVLADRDDAARAFGTHGLTGDPASLVISRRDAGDRVAAITTGEELRELMARATRSGDEVLARAAAERALEMGDTKTLNKFIEDRPQLEAAVERLWKAEQASSDMWAINVRLLGLRPVELHSMGFDSIESLARDGEPVQASAGGW